MRRLAPVLLLLVVAVLATAAPVSAHSKLTPVVDTAAPAPEPVGALLQERLTAAPGGPDLGWVALAVVASAALALLASRRRAMALLLVLIAGVLAFESGVHSVHHLGDDASCAVAWVSGQLSGEVLEVTVAAAPLAITGAGVPAAPTPAADSRSLAPDAGRAPPSASA